MASDAFWPLQRSQYVREANGDSISGTPLEEKPRVPGQNRHLWHNITGATTKNGRHFRKTLSGQIEN